MGQLKLVERTASVGPRNVLLCWILTTLVALCAYLATGSDSVRAMEDIGSSMNAGGISSGVDPDGIRRSTNFAIVDSLGQFVVSESSSTNYILQHGYWSSETQILIPADNAIGTTKKCPDGTLARLTGKVVTAGTDRFDKRFYIQDPDWVSGIQVRYGSLGGPSLSAGYSVDVTGRLTTVDGERALEYPYVKPVSYNEPVPDPLFLLSRNAGGESLNDYTPGVWQGLGTNNVGLLATMFGRVTYKDPGGHFFYLDDGCTIDDGAGWAIRASCTNLAAGNTITLPGPGWYVRVTGIVSTDVVQSQNVRCIRPRRQSDIVRIR